MELFLKYQGHLKSNADKEHKHKLRQFFHLQIKKFIESQEHLNGMGCWRMEDFLQKNPNTISAITPLGNFHFAPLISSKLFLFAEINLTILWHDLPGQIIGQGDIDNKLKTLFDALSCPPNIDQIKGLQPENEESPFFCLLEDDKLIQSINIRTHTLLEETIPKNDIFVLIHVQTRQTRLVWGNIGL